MAERRGGEDDRRALRLESASRRFFVEMPGRVSPSEGARIWAARFVRGSVDEFSHQLRQPQTLGRRHLNEFDTHAPAHFRQPHGGPGSHGVLAAR